MAASTPLSGGTPVSAAVLGVAQSFTVSVEIGIIAADRIRLAQK